MLIYSNCDDNELVNLFQYKCPGLVGSNFK